MTEQTKRPKTQHLIVHFDGCAKDNGDGPSGAGWCITTDEGEGICYGYKYLGIKTNNEAEYLALIECLKELNKIKPSSCTIKGDSKLVISQVNRKWKCGAPNLVPLRDVAAVLLKKLNKAMLVHIPREQNGMADRLSNVAVKKKASVTEASSETYDLSFFKTL